MRPSLRDLDVFILQGRATINSPAIAVGSNAPGLLPTTTTGGWVPARRRSQHSSTSDKGRVSTVSEALSVTRLCELEQIYFAAAVPDSGPDIKLSRQVPII